MTPTVAELFDIAIFLEEAGEGVYGYWQTLFADYPKVATFWKEYQEEELQHAGLLRKIKSNLSPERLAEPADSAVYQAACEVRENLKHIKRDVNSLDEALELAVQYENSEINTILELLVTHFSGEEGTKELVHEQMRKHVEKLNKLSPALIFGKDYKTIKAVR